MGPTPRQQLPSVRKVMWRAAPNDSLWWAPCLDTRAGGFSGTALERARTGCLFLGVLNSGSLPAVALCSPSRQLLSHNLTYNTFLCSMRKWKDSFLAFCIAAMEVATSSLCSCLASPLCSCHVPVSPHATIGQTLGTTAHAVYAEWNRTKT